MFKKVEPRPGLRRLPLNRQVLRTSPSSPLALVKAAPAAGATNDETELVRAAIRGDAQSAMAIWDQYISLVRGLLSKSLGSRADVDDAVQEVFIKVFRSLPKLRQVESLRSYIVATTLCTARSELRKRRVRKLFGLEAQSAPLPEASAASTDLGVRIALQRLELALDSLKPDDRIAFCLRYIEAMELTEVASAMGWSLASTKRYLSRARKRLWVLVGKDPVLAPYLQTAADPKENEL